MAKQSFLKKINPLGRKKDRLDRIPVEEGADVPTYFHEVNFNKRVSVSPWGGDMPTEVELFREETQGHDEKGMFRPLRNKWLWLSIAGIFFGIVGIMLGSGLARSPKWGAQKPVEIYSGPVKQDGKLVQTAFQSFFVPLAGNSEKIAIKLDIEVRWDPETLNKYREKSAFVRNNLLTFFLRVAKSNVKFDIDRSQFESEIEKILEHALAVKNIEAHLDSLTPI